MRIKKLTFIMLVLLIFNKSLYAGQLFSIEQLEGTWWSDKSNPSADFSIRGNKVWLDVQSKYHQCWIEDDVLIFELGWGKVRNRILSINEVQVVLENLDTKQVSTLTREQSIVDKQPELDSGTPLPAR